MTNTTAMLEQYTQVIQEMAELEKRKKIIHDFLKRQVEEFGAVLLLTGNPTYAILLLS